MGIRNFRHFLTGAGFVLMAVVASGAGAWTKDIDKLKDINTLCKFEPEAQCSWAIRIGAKAAGVDMHDSSMASMRLDNADLQGADLSGSILQLSSLEGANLMLANLEKAHMHGTNLRGANLMLANLVGVNLLDADLTGANLRGANLLGAIIIKARFDNATWTDGRICAAESIGECR
ncbi:MAG: pentapeptide repeat-containing protein [Proteobacteria bacterium]|nr:MAG: pentapeptide repeat-containing protein [Pseudomonadota bacterium]QKK12390.1 MAG: pentapeptide repeat-containing protein [Pseudomonadota bacterium]